MHTDCRPMALRDVKNNDLACPRWWCGMGVVCQGQAENSARERISERRGMNASRSVGMFNQNPRSHQKNKDNGMYVEPTQPPLAESGLGWEKHQLPRDEREEGENPPRRLP